MLNHLTIISFLIGYRKIWKIIQGKGVPVKRQTVMEILQELDPEGVQARKKKRLRRRIYSVPGPDHLWHIDGYDKLKPYGFSIHGCIDGFSRRLIWLEVCPSNKNPNVIAKFFIDAVKQLKGIPMRIRCDDGSENCVIEPIQIALRMDDDDEFNGEGSFLIKKIGIDKISYFEDRRVVTQPEDNSPEFLEFVSLAAELKGIDIFRPKSTKDALELYFILLEIVKEFM